MRDSLGACALEGIVKLVKQFFAIVAGFLLVGLLLRLALRSLRHSTDTLARDVAAASTQLNRRLPIMVDQETQIVSTAALDHVLQYNYQLIHVTVGQVDTTVLAAAARPQVTQFACSTPQTLNAVLKRGVTLRYSYADNKGQHLFTFDVTAHDCGF
jgi:hypothetical protein